MSTPDTKQARPVNADPADHYPIRPVGTWVVAGFLVLSIVVIWTLVALVFAGRS